jgi:hypothetical protein
MESVNTAIRCPYSTEAGSKRKEPTKAVVPADNAAERKRDPAKGKEPWKEKPKPKEI